MVTNYQCNHYVVCPPVLSNETMKPSKLQRHLKTTHAHLKSFLITCLKSFFGGPADIDETISQSVRANFKSLLSSCITCRSDQTAIHNCGKFNIASSYMCKTMFGKDEYVKKTEKHTNAMDELAADVRALSILVAKLPKADYFALQLDESTDVSNDAQLFCGLSTKMRCRRNFYSVSSCLEVKKVQRFSKRSTIFSVNIDIPWPKCVAMCTDGAKAMYRENVVAKDMNDEFSNVRSLTRYKTFHPYLSFSSYSILCPSLIEYRVMANCEKKCQ